jgi:16S rRNA C967 or C1407 C5-methylase (RsmB/RsmF family)
VCITPHDDFLKIRLEDGGKLCHEYPEYFDRILLDAPCSAEARFQIDDIRTMGYWNEHKVKEMAQKQRRLLLGAWHALKVGGTLVYSTCTFAPEENELQISKFLKKIESGVRVEPVELSSLKKLPILTSWKEKPLNSQVTKCLRIHPTDEIEGFFIAKFTKTASQPLQQPRFLISRSCNGICTSRSSTGSGPSTSAGVCTPINDR